MLPTSALQPFVPGGPDFALSKRFYLALGFTLDFESGAGDVASFSCDSGKFLLQNAAFEGWGDNFMMSLAVPDLDAWWAHIESLDLAGRFGVRAPLAPTIQPWGLTVAYVFAPAGPLWHIVQV
jgi:hypothetical protein